MRAVWCIGLAIVLSAPLIHGADRSELQQHARELEGIRHRLTELEEEIRLKQRESGTASMELRDLELALSRASDRLSGIDSQVKSKIATLSRLKSEQQAQERAVADQREQLGLELRSAYFTGRENFLKLLLNQEDPERISRVLVYHEYYSRARAHRIKNLRARLTEIDRLRRAIKLETNKLTRLRVDFENQVEDIDRRRSQRRTLLNRLEAELSEKGQQREALQRDAERLQALILEIERLLQQAEDFRPEQRPFAELKGQLSWPTDGEIVKSFGSARDDGTFKWQGVLMEAPLGTDVHAISYGRVVFADWFQHLGLLLILDHGDGYMSLYGHNQTLFKSVGDVVAAGEVIARVGDTGGRNLSALYFEVRKDGVPADPAGWCARVTGSL